MRLLAPMAMVALVALLASVCGCSSPPPTSTVPVRYAEATLHGFLVMKDASGAVIAHGDQIQTMQGADLNAKTAFGFSDGSYFEEKVTYTQDGVFRMRSYSLIARGPAFKKDWEIHLDADAQKYRLTTQERGKQPETSEGPLAIPSDTSNGMVPTLAKNLMSQGSVRVHFVAFTPEPRIVVVEVAVAGQDGTLTGSASSPVFRFVAKPELDGLTRFFAKLLGKLPPDAQIWIVGGEMPGFLRSEASMVPDEPVWRIELAAPPQGTASVSPALNGQGRK